MKIGILGAGRLGLCFALNLERCGYEVTGVDISEEYITALNRKTFFSHEPQVNELLHTAKNFKATTNIKEVLLDEFGLLFLMVATPSLSDGSYNHTQIERVAAELIKHGERKIKTHLVVGCTVMPGYCDELQKKVEKYNYAVSYNPEFIAQGNIIHDQVYPDQILIGEANLEIGNILEDVYKKMCKSNPMFCRMNRLSAEICKIATNCFLTTKISFANSVGDLAIKVGAEPEKILSAIGADSRIGSKCLQYGFGFGGPCFPRDNRALNLFARQSGFNLLISEATDNVNMQHLNFQFEHYMGTYKENETIVFEEVVYKKGTVILEESQQLALALKLAHAGRKVLVREKETVIEELKKNYGSLFSYELSVS